MDSAEKIMQSYLNLWNKYKSDLPEADYFQVRDTLVDLDPQILLVAHCLAIVIGMRKYTGGKHGFLKSIVLSFVVSFGGAIINSILMAKPSPVAVEDANVLVPTFLICWWLVNCVSAFRWLMSWKAISAALSFVACFAKVRAIAVTMDAVAKQVPNGWVATLILGGIAGSGGLVFLDMDKKFRTGFNHMSTFSAPEWPLKSAFLTAVIYYVLSDPHGYISNFVDLPSIPVKDLKMGLGCFLGTLAVIEVFAGRSFNPFYMVERTLVTSLGLKIDQSSAPSTKTSSTISPDPKKKNQ